jgi:hypothetical protein
MTCEDILNMPAGPKLDDLVAEKVMNDPMGQVWSRHYSTDISAAWEVLEKLFERGWYAEIITDAKTTEIDFEIAIRDRNNGTWTLDTGVEDGWITDGWVVASTAPLAICRAALLAVMEKE